MENAWLNTKTLYQIIRKIFQRTSAETVLLIPQPIIGLYSLNTTAQSTGNYLTFFNVLYFLFRAIIPLLIYTYTRLHLSVCSDETRGAAAGVSASGVVDT